MEKTGLRKLKNMPVISGMGRQEKTAVLFS
jgi:hypothetical protein